jgi:hypothetical protein
MGDIMYATREDVRHAVDEAGASRDATEIDRALAAATEKINGTLKRDFAPWTGTKYFDWPSSTPACSGFTWTTTLSWSGCPR